MSWPSDSVRRYMKGLYSINKGVRKWSALDGLAVRVNKLQRHDNIPSSKRIGVFTRRDDPQLAPWGRRSWRRWCRTRRGQRSRCSTATAQNQDEHKQGFCPQGKPAKFLTDASGENDTCSPW